MCGLVLETLEDQCVQRIIAGRFGHELAQQAAVASMQRPGVAVQTLQLSVLLLFKQPGQQRLFVITVHPPGDKGAGNARQLAACGFEPARQGFRAL
ncbi:hypothetical protein D3C72_2106790 [compost metagenome]